MNVWVNRGACLTQNNFSIACNKFFKNVTGRTCQKTQDRKKKCAHIEKSM